MRPAPATSSEYSEAIVGGERVCLGTSFERIDQDLGWIVNHGLIGLVPPATIENATTPVAPIEKYGVELGSHCCAACFQSAARLTGVDYV